MTFNQTLTLIVFGLVYLYLIVCSKHMAKALWIGMALLVVLPLPFGRAPILWPQDMFVLRQQAGGWTWASVNWNVMGIMAGTLLLAGVFIWSRVPVVLSDLLIDKSPNVCWAAEESRTHGAANWYRTSMNSRVSASNKAASRSSELGALRNRGAGAPTNSAYWIASCRIDTGGGLGTCQARP